jgi:hypothetical protein
VETVHNAPPNALHPYLRGGRGDPTCGAVGAATEKCATLSQFVPTSLKPLKNNEKAPVLIWAVMSVLGKSRAELLGRSLYPTCLSGKRYPTRGSRALYHTGRLYIVPSLLRASHIKDGIK